MTILPPPLRDAGPLETMEAQAIDARSGETEGLDPIAMNEWRRLSSPYRNYEVSDAGAVRRGGREMAGAVDRYGYRTVLLSYAGLSKRFKVHRLVCEAFHGEPSAGQDARHLDGNRSNNASSNLAWGSRAQNVMDAVRHGTHHANRGESHPKAKLTAEQVASARDRHRLGESGRSLAREYGITSANMSRLLRGETWATRQDAPEQQAGPLNTKEGE